MKTGDILKKASMPVPPLVSHPSPRMHPNKMHEWGRADTSISGERKEVDPVLDRESVGRIDPASICRDLNHMSIIDRMTHVHAYRRVF